LMRSVSRMTCATGCPRSWFWRRQNRFDCSEPNANEKRPEQTRSVATTRPPGKTLITGL
jgi:hypothetical protein